MLTDADDRRGERDERGRPWYSAQYLPVSSTQLGGMIQIFVQAPIAIVAVIGVHYVLIVPYKVGVGPRISCGALRA